MRWDLFWNIPQLSLIAFSELFGNEFKIWTEEEVNACWKLDNGVALHNKMN